MEGPISWAKQLLLCLINPQLSTASGCGKSSGPEADISGSNLEQVTTAEAFPHL